MFLATTGIESDVNQLQEEILKVYQEFKKLCDDHGLRYYAIYGTAIGAARHQGFIPWDDDMDLFMPYSDCLALMEILHSSDQEYSISMRDRSLDEDNRANIFKVYSKNSIFIENSACFPKNFYGVFVDLFPLIGTPETHNEREVFFTEILRLKRDIYWNERFVVGEKSAEIQQLLGLFSAYDYNASSKVASPQLCLRERVFDREEFDDPIEMCFEDTTIWVPRNYDDRLTQVYGDYMTLPPESQRSGHHATNALINFDTPYLTYTQEIESSPIKGYVDYMNGEIITLKKEVFDKDRRAKALERPTMSQWLRFLLQAIRRKLPRLKRS